MTHFLIRGLAGALIIGAAFAAPALGEDPVLVAGNPSCSTVDGTETWKEVKLDNEPGPGTVALPPGDLSGSVTIDAAREYFDFTVSPGVDAVIVKAGNAANVYYYEPDATHREGLHGPIASSGRPHQISHISFCYGPDDAPPPPPDDDDTIAIDVEKQVRNGSSGDFVDGPVAAGEGNRVEYEMTAVNAGEAPLMVDFTDTAPGCDTGTLTGPVKTGGDADEWLEVSETWTWHCAHVITADDVTAGSASNTATALGTAADGRTDDDSDSAGATVSPGTADPVPGNNGFTPSSGSGTAGQQSATSPTAPTASPAPGGQLEVLPASVVSGASRMTGPSRCVSGRFAIRVSGRSIASVRVRIDGRTVRRYRSASGDATRFVHRIDGRRFGPGIHRVVVRVTYAATAQTRPRTHRLAFQRCGRQGVLPQFTG